MTTRELTPLMFKNLTLAYFGQYCTIALREGTPTHSKYGSEIKGNLTTRIWAERFISPSSKVESVIAITISSIDSEITIPYKDIVMIT